MKFKTSVKLKNFPEIKTYLKNIEKSFSDYSYSSDESFLAMVSDKKLFALSEMVAKEKKRFKPQELLVVGIGGSSLGAKAVCDALGTKYCFVSFFDTISVYDLECARERIKCVYSKGGSIVLNIISKSGKTVETLVNASILIEELKKVDNDWALKTVITTEPDSELWNWASKNRITCLPVYKNIGGRFSVFGPCGAFPVLVAGFSAKNFLSGASLALRSCSQFSDANPALMSAISIFDSIKSGCFAHNFFVFEKRFESLGKWCAQLSAESLGKDKKGFLPITSVGTSDLHSLYQLFMGGPKNVFTTFVSVKKASDLKIPSQDKDFDSILGFSGKKTAMQVFGAIRDSVVLSYSKNNLKFCEIEFEKISEQELGEFMQFKMMETLILSKIFDVNPFGQPDVEKYKQIARKILE